MRWIFEVSWNSNLRYTNIASVLSESETESKQKIRRNKVRFHCLFAFRLILNTKTSNTVNVLKLRTLKNNYFSAVRNFRNYVCEKVPVSEILECGLYHEKNGIYACQNVIEKCCNTAI